MDNKLQRQRRINNDGEWEYLCPYCNTWKLKERFKGCVDKIDGFGNCRKCRSCISSYAHSQKDTSIRKQANILMIKLGYEVGNPDNPVWVQFHKKYNLPF
jgi:hypothetical protein